MKRILLALLVMGIAFGAHAMKGDVNGDGEVNIADVNAIISIILNS